MIQKILTGEYLKRVDNMTAAEREEYMKMVGEWLEKQASLLLPRANDEVARFQNAIQCSAGWNDAECAAWHEGARLLSALAAKGDTWLPEMLYVKAARRAVRQMVNTLTIDHSPLTIDHSPLTIDHGGAQSQRMVAGASKEAGYGKVAKEEPAEGTVMATQAVAAAPMVNGQSSMVNCTPVRPKHIDQYVHLLPQKTQEKAATVKGLLRDLDVAREKMRLLMDDPKASDDSRAQWAKAATALDGKVKAIYKELDAEWEKLVKQGRVTVDDFGNARVVTDAEATGMVAAERNNDMTESRNNGEEEAAKEKRIEYLKKWLRDTRTKASDERKKQWEQNCKELLALGGELTGSIRKAGEVYGVNLDDITK